MPNTQRTSKYAKWNFTFLTVVPLNGFLCHLVRLNKIDLQMHEFKSTSNEYKRTFSL